jgi:hypothetical protein
VARPDQPFADAYDLLARQQGPGAGTILDDPDLRARLTEAIAAQQHTRKKFTQNSDTPGK